MSRHLMGALGLLIAAVLLVAINVLSNNLLRGARVDLTENDLYTLTEGSRNIVSDLEEPIRLRFFFSEDAAANEPFLRSYATRVRELLQEYVALSKGKITLEVIDPEAFSEEEDMAVSAGIQGVPGPSGDRFYFGLQGVNSTDLEEVIPFFDQRKESFLEYDITSMIHKLANPDLPTVAVLSSLPIEGEEVDQRAAMMGQQSGEEPWVFFDIIEESYDTISLDNSATEIPAETDVLLLVHPRELSEETEYAIDQFVLRGGRVLAFVDPHAEVYQPPQNPNNPMASMGADRSSNLERLMEAWGLAMDTSSVVADRSLAQRVNVGSRQRPEVSPYILWLSTESDQMNESEFTVSQLQVINFATAGALEQLGDADTEFFPLVQTTEDSSLIPTESIRFMPRPQQLLAEFDPDSNIYTLAARVSGEVRSAFPDGIESEEVDTANHLAESEGSINVIMVADVDLLEDSRWVQQQGFLGQSMMYPTANTGDMVVNFLDQLSGSSDLISIRGRSGYNRPFTVVEELEQEAVEQYAARRQELENRVQELNRSIMELRRGQTGGDGSLILTPEQRQEIERMNEQLVEANRELRRVNYALRQDVENLGTSLKFYNILLVPLVVGFLAIGLGVYRSQRRKILRRQLTSRA